jgi:hypothetical protein
MRDFQAGPRLTRVRRIDGFTSAQPVSCIDNHAKSLGVRSIDGTRF